MTKILVTGAAGMIGSHLTEILLNRDYKVLGLDNLLVGQSKNLPSHNNFKFINGSVLDHVLIQNLIKQVDIIVHLATLKKGSNLLESRTTLRMISQSADILMNEAFNLKKRFKQGDVDE